MSIVTGIGCYAIHHNSPKAREERYKQFERRMEEISKNSKKRDYINKFIDEIPDLSYFEAKQLQKKLGKIYIEWNDE